METLSEDQIKGEVLDHLGLVSATIGKLGLIEKIDQALPVSANKGSKVSMGQRVAAMILNGLGFMNDRLYMFPDFLSNKPVERLLNAELCAEDFNDDVLGRALDEIYWYGSTKLFTEIAFAVGVENNLLGPSVHFDTSSLSVYGEYLETEKTLTAREKELKKRSVGMVSEEKTQPPIDITYGYSKDHRRDLKQMVINLATTGASGFPIWMEAHSGNASDKKILLEAASRMKDFCKNMQGIPDFLYVGDSAMYENCVKKGGEMKWLSRVTETISEAKRLVQRPEEEFKWEQQENGYKITPIMSNYGGVKQRWLMVSSLQAYKRESVTLDKNIVKEKNELEKALWHLSHQEFQCDKDAYKAATLCIKKIKYHQIVFVTSEFKKHETAGRPKKDSQEFKMNYKIHGTITEDAEKITLFRREKGRFILATNELDEKKLPDAMLLPEYKGQSTTESGFRFIKNDAFEVSSVFLKKPERIEALMMIMTLCLMVYSFAQHHLRSALERSGETIPNQLKKPTKTPSMAWVCRLFHGVQVLHIQLPTMTQCLVINLTEITRKIIRLFGKQAEYIYGLATG